MYFSRTFKALNFDFQFQGLSRTFKVHANPVYKGLYGNATVLLEKSILLTLLLCCIFCCLPAPQADLT